jgi:hypothetical protein
LPADAFSAGEGKEDVEGGAISVLTGAVFLSYASGDAAAAERITMSLRAAGIDLTDADMAFLLPVVIDDTRDDDERVPERIREVLDFRWEPQ